MFKILSFDGGGIRGLMSAVWLQALEERIGAPVGRRFDLVAGTSTGAILAAAVATGRSTEEMVQLYRRRGREIFPSLPSRLWERITRLPFEGPSSPKYDGKGLSQVLQEEFAGLRLSDVSVPTLLTTYDVSAREGVVFKSKSVNDQPLPLWEIVRASCSAPVYFPAHVMNIKGKVRPLIDGGVVANNPAACAIAEAIRMGADADPQRCLRVENVLLASFGTGSVTRSITAEEAKEWGALEWALPIIDVLFDGAGDATDYICRQLLPSSNYFRFQTPLKDAYDDLDRVDEVNLHALMDHAQQFLRGDGAVMIERLAAKLV